SKPSRSQAFWFSAMAIRPIRSPILRLPLYRLPFFLSSLEKMHPIRISRSRISPSRKPPSKTRQSRFKRTSLAPDTLGRPPLRRYSRRHRPLLLRTMRLILGGRASPRADLAKARQEPRPPELVLPHPRELSRPKIGSASSAM